jgi:hypothetical protein
MATMQVKQLITRAALAATLGIWVQGNKVIVSNSPHVWVFP